MEYLIDFAVLGLVYLLVCLRRWKAKGKDVLFVRTTMYVYLSFVLYFTLMPITVSIPTVLNHPYRPMELTPFSDVLLGRGDFVRQIVLNTIMTMPFGFLFPLMKQDHSKFGKTVLCCFLLSLDIELLQPLINGVRSSDITDLITNTVGGMLGYVCYLLFRPVTTGVLRRIKGR